jgi:hypothetical protein
MRLRYVMPAQAGIQSAAVHLDSRIRAGMTA